MSARKAVPKPTLEDTLVEAAPEAPQGSVADRIIATARDIINETGDFDLPMRLLASRAKVSLRTPYTLFGSKNGVISEILHADQKVWNARLKPLQTGDPIVDLFANMERGVEFYRSRQPFYRALFRATQSYSGGPETEPARQNLRPMQVICRRLRTIGLLHPGIDPDTLGESLTDIVASAVREWACSTFDVQLILHRTCFGYATLLAGATIEPTAGEMRALALRHQSEIAKYPRE